MSIDLRSTPDDRLARAHARFDAENAQDPTLIDDAGAMRPRELVQADRLEAWVRKLAPDASLALRLAARCQHLARYRIPRSNYGEGRIEYLKWRKDLARMHADLASRILREEGFDDDTIARVRAINLKQDLKSNPDAQTMEDALCLSFLEHDFVPFIPRYDDDKVVDIVRKSWRKMSRQGHDAALGLPLDGRALDLVKRALAVA
jgi:hypothetical protein